MVRLIYRGWGVPWLREGQGIQREAFHIVLVTRVCPLAKPHEAALRMFKSSLQPADFPEDLRAVS